MGSPCEDNLRTFVGSACYFFASKEWVGSDDGLVFVLFNSDEVGKGLERVDCGALHEEYWSAAVFNELVEDFLFIVILS